MIKKAKVFKESYMSATCCRWFNEINEKRSNITRLNNYIILDKCIKLVYCKENITFIQS